MCAAKTDNNVWQTTKTGLLLYAFALLWVLWILFGYRSSLLPEHAHREIPGLRLPTATTPASLQPENITSSPKKASVTAATTKRRQKSSGIRDTCWKPQCIALADIIADGLGKANPCEDFHGFVCGDQEGRKEGLASAMKTSTVRELKDILKYSKSARNRTEQEGAADKFRAAYQSCLSTRNDVNHLKKAVLSVLKKLGIEDWPLMKKEHVKKANESYQDALKKIGLHPFFQYYVRIKSKQANGKPTIIVTKPTDFFVYSDTPSLVSARKLKNTASQQDITHEDPIIAKYKRFIARTIALFNPSISEDHCMLLANDILAFEKTLYQLSNRSTLKKIEIKVVSSNATLSSSNFTIQGALQKELDAVSITLDDKIKLVLEYPDYYRSFLNIMSKVKDTNTIKNYAAWKHIRSFAVVEGGPLHALYSKYKTNTTLSEWRPSKSDVVSSCINYLLQPHMMPIAGSSLFIKYKFNKYDRRNVKKIISLIVSSFTNIVKENKWMSDIIKKKVIMRFSRMELVIAYPEWMLDEAVVDGFYKFIPHLSENDSFVEHLAWIQENNRNQQLLKLKPDFEEREFGDVALFPRMYYIERTDTLVLPAATLAPYYKRTPMPRALNFGTIGALASFLIINALDRFDIHLVSKNESATGRKIVTEEFWDQKTKQNFCKASDCLKNEECNNTKQLDQTESEARFGEYVGLRASFTAMKKSTNNYTKPHLLPGTHFNTEDKVFFLSFGHLYCPFKSVELLPRSRSYGLTATQEGSIYKKRLNDILKSHDGFQKTYGCALTKDHCELMPPGVRR